MAFLSCPPVFTSSRTNRQLCANRHRGRYVLSSSNERRASGLVNANQTTHNAANTTTKKSEIICNVYQSGEERKAIIVVDHGSKRQAANDMIFKVAYDLRKRTSPDIQILPAHMELAAPSISDAVADCANMGVTHVIVVPFFLSPGRHATEDIPQLTESAVKQFANMTYEVRPPIGTHPSIIDIVLDSAGISEKSL